MVVPVRPLAGIETRLITHKTPELQGAFFCSGQTEEEFVACRAVHGEQSLWIRQKSMFVETVTV